MEIPTKALSIRAPWWWFILHGGKDYENKGMLGFFTVPPDVLELVRVQTGKVRS